MAKRAQTVCALSVGCALCLLTIPVAASGITIIHQFSGGAEGSGPEGLVTDGSSLYGVATAGPDDSRNGEVFQLSLDAAARWRETVLYAFPNGFPNGSPNPELTFGQGGALYGTSMFGGVNGTGTVFRLTPPAHGGAWSYQLLHTFPPNNSRQGFYPSGRLLITPRGDIFGTTPGSVYELSPPASGSGPWTYSQLYAFGNPPDASVPEGGLMLGADGDLYGASNQGGTGGCLDGSDVDVIGCGTVFRLSYAQGRWTEQVLYSFNLHQWNPPFDTVTIGDDGSLYGEAFYDMYRLSPPHAPGRAWRYQVIYEFPLGPKAGFPAAHPVLDYRGDLLDTLDTFGTTAVPSLFRLSPSLFPDAPWLETTLARLPNDHDAGGEFGSEEPDAPLLKGPFGAYYGTVGGSAAGAHGYVFSFVP